MAKIFSPKDAQMANTNSIPDVVYDSFNYLLGIKYCTSSPIEITTEEVITEILSREDITRENITREDLFNKHWLDVEEAYRANGWNVEYIKPGYVKTFDPYYRFTAYI